MKLVHGHPNLRKGNGVILNVSQEERRSYRMAKQQAIQQRESQEEIVNLRSELDEIKGLLHQLLNK